MQREILERKIKFELREWKKKFQKAETKEGIEEAEKELNQIIKKYWPLVFTPEIRREMEMLSKEVLKGIEKFVELVDEFLKTTEGNEDEEDK